MDIKQNIDNLSRDAREFLNLKIDEIKLSLVERLSLLMAESLSWLAVLVFLLLSFLCLLAALVAVLSLYVGLLPALLFVAFMLFAISLMLYLNRYRLFDDIMVARIYKIFYNKTTCNNEDEHTA